jgi:hypothetical protein
VPQKMETSHSHQQTGYYSGSGTPVILIVGEPAASNVHHRKAMLYRILVLTLLWPFGAFAQTAQVDPLTLRTRDVHQNLTIVVDPYLSADRYDKGLFGKTSPYEAGIAAINVYFRNDNDSPIRLNLDTIRLVISTPGEERQRLEPLSPEEVADRALLKARANPPATRRPFPFPGSPSNSGRGKSWNEMASTLRSVVLSTEVLPPHATTHGFLFFDMDHQFDAIRHSRVYIPDLSFMTDKKALFFFEIDLSIVPAN